MKKQRSPLSETTGVTEKQEQRSPRRRLGGRSARVRAAVFDATLQALQERGFELTSVAEIASRAGVHETSIYRRWGTKEALLVEAVLARTEDVIRVPDTGALRSDLVQLLEELMAFLQSPLGVAITQLLAATVGNVEMATARQSYWSRRFTLVKVMFERAVQRGEINAAIDPQLVTETVIGPLYMRLLLTSEPLHGNLPEQLVDLVLHGIAVDH